MSTMQEVCDRARIPLNDGSKNRYSDADLLVFANAAINRAYQLRPDLRFGSSYSTPYSDLAIGSTFPLPGHFLQVIADYATGRASTIDDEVVNGARAVEFIKLFEAQVVSQ